MPIASYFQVPKKIEVLAIVAICLALRALVYFFNVTGTLSEIYITYPTITQQEREIHEQKWGGLEPRPINCDWNHFDYDLCYLSHSTVLDPTTATFFTRDPTNSTPQSTVKILPYPRVLNAPVMLVSEVTLTTAPTNLSCTVKHTRPALVFSAGGWSGNYFHDFNDKFIPLFITVDTFFPDHDFILVISNSTDWWVRRYADLLSSFTRQRIVDMNRETITHCFPSVIVGLVSHGPTNIDPTLQRKPHPKTLYDFRALLAATYSQSHAIHANKHHINLTPSLPLSLPPPSRFLRKPEGRPRLVFINRNGSRRILNIENVRRVAENVGFDVVVLEPSRAASMHEIFKVIDGSHALVGVHGAGLTNILFLRPGSVFMQMLPPVCGWMGSYCFGKMAVRLGLEYLYYNIGENESVIEFDEATREWLRGNLSEAQRWVVYREQFIKLDLVRVKRYLKRVYKKAKVFMLKESLDAGNDSKMRQSLT